MTQTKNVLQDIAVAAAVDSRARRFAHLSPHSLSLLSVLPTDADVRSRRRARALCGIGIFRESTRSLRQGRRKCCGEAGRPVGGGGRRCWRGRKGRPLSRSASCCCVALTPLFVDDDIGKLPFGEGNTLLADMRVQMPTGSVPLSVGAEVEVDGTNSLVREGQRQ